MPDWTWLIALFAALTFGYFIGFCGGVWKAGDECPSENAWINVRKYSIDAQKEINIHGIAAQHEEEMAMIQRGVYDNLSATEEFYEGKKPDGQD